MSRLLKRTGISVAFCDALSTIGITTCSDLLTASPLVIMTCCDLSYVETIALIHEISTKVTPLKHNTALTYLKERQKESKTLLTGFSELDQALKGGLLLGTVTDICGPPGIGKTQLCMSCALHTLVASNRERLMNHTLASSSSADSAISVIYIDAECKFDSLRFLSIAELVFPEFFSLSYTVHSPHNIDFLLECLKTIRPSNRLEFENEIKQLEITIVKNKAKLVRNCLLARASCFLLLASCFLLLASCLFPTGSHFSSKR
jgi:RecA/RadA recombinase